jgi:hypothetical protein
MIKLVEVCEMKNASNSSQRTYTLREIYVNPKHVVSLREELAFQHKLAEGKMPEGLDPRQGFTRITLDRGQSGLDVIVVGQPNIIESKFKGAKRELLHG